MELREDLQIPIVKEKIQRISDSYETETINHPYALANTPYADSTVRKLRKKQDLVT